MFELFENKQYAVGSALGQAAVNNYNALSNVAVPPPLTLSSALSKAEGLNERIQQTMNRLGDIAGKLGALYPAEGSPSKTGQIPNGVVGKLNEVTDIGHDRMCEVEALLAGIERALG